MISQCFLLDIDGFRRSGCRDIESLGIFFSSERSTTPRATTRAGVSVRTMTYSPIQAGASRGVFRASSSLRCSYRAIESCIFCASISRSDAYSLKTEYLRPGLAALSDTSTLKRPLLPVGSLPRVAMPKSAKSRVVPVPKPHPYPSHQREAWYAKARIQFMP